MTSYDEKVRNTYTFRKTARKAHCTTEKIRNTCSKAAHTGSASIEDIITQHPYILTQKACYRTPQVAKGTPNPADFQIKAFPSPSSKQISD